MLLTWVLLLAAVAGLLAGPLLFRVREDWRAWWALLDGFVLVTVGGIAALHLLPEALEHGGLLALVFAAIGAVAPVALERKAAQKRPRLASWLLVLGLVPHAMLESAALGVAHPEHLLTVGLAVAAHRLPVGMVVYSVAQRGYGRTGSLLALAALALATLAGFGAGEWLEATFSEPSFSWLQALVGGSLLHVAFAHRIKGSGQGHHAHSHSHEQPHAHEHGHAHGHAHTQEHKHDHDHDEHKHDPPHQHHDHAHHEHKHAHGHEHAHQRHEHDHKHVHEHAHPSHDHGHEHAHEAQHGHEHAHSSGQDAEIDALLAGHAHKGDAQTLWSATGALLGVGILVLALWTNEGHRHAEELHVGDTFLALALESGPALLLAYVLAGLMGVVITPARARWLGRGGQASQALRGVAFGLPLPVCSCGVLPLYEALVRRGVPATAAVGFLIATPELGLDAILLSVPLLGGELTVARLVAAFAVALVTALVVGRVVGPPTPVMDSPEGARQQPPLRQRVVAGLRFGLEELFDHTMPWVLAGLLVAAWAQPLLSHQWLQAVPDALQVPLFALLGIPIYVCASGATPLAAVAIFAGVSPGAALAFLLAGPATNVTTFGVMRRLHGQRAALWLGVVVVLGAILAGWGVNALSLETLTGMEEHHHEEHPWWQWGSLAALALLLLASVFRQGPRGVIAQLMDPVET